jgi:hypothetical protein
MPDSYGQILELPFAHVRSLVWSGDSLIDWLGGANAYGLDGSCKRGQTGYSYRFDSVLRSPSGLFAALYERSGTKALLLKGREVIREINRSYYQAHVYDYPIALFRLPNGDEALAHCPDEYNVLEIERLETGERLTRRADGAPEADDFFHSGLTIDPTGRWLASVGWVWQPFCSVSVYPIAEVLADPRLLDGVRDVGGQVEVYSAVFDPDGRLVVAAHPESDDYCEDEPDVTGELRLRPGRLGVFRLDPPAASQASRPSPGGFLHEGPGDRWESMVPLPEATGRLFSVDSERLLALYEHPFLIEVATGQVLQRWLEINTGKWACCINRGMDLPPYAWDPEHRRLAVAAPDRMRVLQL